jgi:AcrR family transcriptional regulator
MSAKQSTKKRLIEAAGRIFSEKGYHLATVAEICEAADANIASVNYYFGDKETLYDEVWQRAFSTASERHPLAGGLPDNPDAEEYLFRYASAILHRIFSDDESGLFAKLLYREMASPTLALNRIVSAYLFPQNRPLRSILEGMLGPGFDEQTLMLCQHSIIGQCAFYNFSRPLREKVLGRSLLSEKEIERTARHIARFSLGGLNAVKEGR